MSRGRLAAALAVAIAGVVAPQARADVFGQTSLVSGDPIQQASYAHDPAVSGDGRFVVFDASVGGINGIWRRELSTGDLLEVAGGDAELPSISADGRYVSFTTNQGGNLAAFTDGRQHFEAKVGESPNVYVRDMALSPQQPGAFQAVSAPSGSNEPLHYLSPRPGDPKATEEYGALAAGRTAMNAEGTEVAFVTTAVSNLTSYPSLELEELGRGETPAPHTPYLQVGVRDLQTGITQLVSVRRDPVTGKPAIDPETGDPEPVPTALESSFVYGAVDTEGVLPFFRAEVPPYKRTDRIGASISADGTTVAWMGQQTGEQTASLPGEPPKPSWTEPLWRRIAHGEEAPTRKVTGGADPESAACQASGEQALPIAATTGDPCQGPFETGSRTRSPRTRPFGPANRKTTLFRSSAATGTPSPSWRRRRCSVSPARAAVTATCSLRISHPGLTRTQALEPLTRFASLSETAIATNSAITDIAISPNASAAGHTGQVAFTTMRTVFPLGSPSYVSPRAAAPGLNELYDADLGNETLTRVTGGYEGGPPSHPFLEEKSGCRRPLRGVRPRRRRDGAVLQLRRYRAGLLGHRVEPRLR